MRLHTRSQYIELGNTSPSLLQLVIFIKGSTTNLQHILVNGEKIKQVDSFNYLVAVVTSDTIKTLTEELQSQRKHSMTS